MPDNESIKIKTVKLIHAMDRDVGEIRNTCLGSSPTGARWIRLPDDASG